MNRQPEPGDIVHILEDYELEGLALALAARHVFPYKLHLHVYGVPRGGEYVAARVAALTGMEQVSTPIPGCLIVDDLVDTGRTLETYYRAGYEVDALLRKEHSPRHLAGKALTYSGWIAFPWEKGELDLPLAENRPTTEEAI